MKLNLLPTHVSKASSTRTFLVIAVVIFLVCVLASAFLYTKSNGDLEASKTDVGLERGKADLAKSTSDYADTVMQQSTTLLRNTKLAQAMLAHNSAYPNLYDDVKRYIPSFFRVNNMSAAANGKGSSTVTLVGVLQTPQQYADLMLALLRMPGVQTVSRSGFTDQRMYVPAPTPSDQIGKPIKPGQAPIPDDPIQRLDYFEAQGGQSGYTGTGGFGTGQAGYRGAMPDSSEVTITMVLNRDLTCPDPRATLSMNQAASAPNSGGPGATGGNTPGANAAPSGPQGD